MSAEVPGDAELKKRVLSGRTIEPIQISRGMTVEDLVDVYAGMGYNARRLAEACRTYESMLNRGATVCLTLSGAMTPIGMSGLITSLIERGFIDWIVSTGANCYHDMHRPYDMPMQQGCPDADDNELHSVNVARIFDVFIEDGDTLEATDEVVLRSFMGTPEAPAIRYKGRRYPYFSTAFMCHKIGEKVAETAQHPEKSFLAAAAEHDVPVYVPSWADSSIGMNLALHFIAFLEGKRNVFEPAPSLDILESAALVKYADLNGVVMVGGGVPKNFFMQTQPMCWQMLKDSRGGHDYFIQLTDARADTGGLSGATPSEAKSWGKVADAVKNNVVVYGDASVYLPILGAWVLSRCEPRERKRLYRERTTLTEKVIADYASGFLEADEKEIRESTQLRASSSDAPPSLRG